MDTECERCHDEYYVDGEHEPTKYCNECAHAVVDEQEQRIAALEAGNAELREALAPFAKACEASVRENVRRAKMQLLLITENTMGRWGIKVKHLRAAQDALAGKGSAQ